jgi:hypothetical protein
LLLGGIYRENNYYSNFIYFKYLSICLKCFNLIYSKLSNSFNPNTSSPNEHKVQVEQSLPLFSWLLTELHSGHFKVLVLRSILKKFWEQKNPLTFGILSFILIERLLAFVPIFWKLSYSVFACSK